ncbi:hypothetical protein ACLBOM_11905 [Escherichia coli]
MMRQFPHLRGEGNAGEEASGLMQHCPRLTIVWKEQQVQTPR